MTKKIFIWINGKATDEKEALIPVSDRGFLYGDSLYETLRIYRKMPLCLGKHIMRLERGIKLLRFPGIDYENLKEEIKKAIEECPLQDAYLRVVISRGDKSEEWYSSRTGETRRVIYIGELPPFVSDMYESGVPVIISKFPRFCPGSYKPSIKTGSHIDQVLAQIEAHEKGAFEAVQLSTDGFVAEGASSNFFIVKDKTIVTPSLDTGILDGITRQIVIDIANDIPLTLEERKLSVKEMMDCDEAFITSSLKEIMPVSTIDDNKLHSPGCITNMIMGRYSVKIPLLIMEN